MDRSSFTFGKTTATITTRKESTLGVCAVWDFPTIKNVRILERDNIFRKNEAAWLTHVLMP